MNKKIKLITPPATHGNVQARRLCTDSPDLRRPSCQKNKEGIMLIVIKRVLLITIVGGAACVFAGSAPSTSDSVTSLPVSPGVTDPDPLPKARVCRKTMQGDFYMVMGQK